MNATRIQLPPEVQFAFLADDDLLHVGSGVGPFWIRMNREKATLRNQALRDISRIKKLNLVDVKRMVTEFCFFARPANNEKPRVLIVIPPHCEEQRYRRRFRPIEKASRNPMV